MAALTNTQISVTYVGLLKTSANTVLSSTAQQITDGSGNNSILYLSTAGVGIGGAASSGKELDVTGNVLVTGDLIVDNITIDGNTITSTSADFTIDATHDIILDAAGGNIDFKDNGSAVARFLNSTGSLVILVQGSDKDMLFKGNDGGSEITALTLDMSEAGNATFNSKAIFGSSQDLQIYNDSSNNYIDSTSNELRIRSNDLRLLNYGTAKYITADSGADVSLYHNDSKKFETTSSGVTITGVAVADGLDMGDNEKIRLGASQDLEIYHDSSNSYINESGTGLLKILTNGLEIKNPADNGYMAFFGATGAAELYYNTAKKFETTSGGVTVTGTISSGAITTSGLLTSTLAINQSSLPDAPSEHVITLNPPTTTNYYGGGISWSEGSNTAASLGVYDAGSGGALGFYIATGNNTTLTQALTIDSSQNATFTTSNFNISKGSGAVKLEFFQTNGNWKIEAGNSGNNTLIIGSVSNATNNITLDTTNGGSTTFSGDVTINRASNPTKLQIGSSLADDPFIVFQTDGNTMSMGIDRSDSNKFVISDNATLGTNNRFTIDTSGNSTFAGVVKGNSYFSAESTGNAYIRFKHSTGGLNYVGSSESLASGFGDENDMLNYSVSGKWGVYTNSALALTIDESQNATFAGHITLNGDGKAYKLNTSSYDDWQISVDSNGFIIYNETDARYDLKISGTGNATFAGNITFGDSHFIGDDSDDNLLIQSSANENIIIHSADDIILDVDTSSYIRLKDNGTEFGKISHNSNNLRIFSSISDGDILLQGNDGGTTITALQLDMSAGGNATFAGELTANGDLIQVSGAHPELKLNDSDDSNYSLVSYSDGDLLISTNHGNEAGAADTIRFSNNGGTERMRIDSSGNVLVGKTSSTGVATGNIEVSNSSSASVQIEGGTHEWSMLVSSSADALRFYQDSTEHMRIDSSGRVGIGTTPDTDADALHLDSSGTNSLKIEGAGSQTLYSYHDTGGVGWATGPDTSYTNLIYLDSSNNILLFTNSAERMRITSAGNIEVKTTNGELNFDSGNGVIQTTTGSTSLTFGVNSSEKMRIHSSGNVGIGTTNPTSFNSNADNLVINESGDFTGITLAADNDQGSNIYFADPDDDNVGGITYNHTDNYMNFRVNGAERARITSVGDIGIGSSSPSSYNSRAQDLVIKKTGSDVGISIVAEASSGTDYSSSVLFADGTGGTAGYRGSIEYDHATDHIAIATAASERMRIDSSGSVSIGTTTTQAQLEVNKAADGSTSAPQFLIQGGASTYGAFHFLDSNAYHIQTNSASRDIEIICNTGGVNLGPGDTAFSSNSDENLKENIKPLNNVIDKIKNYRCVEYNFKDDKNKNKKIGFIAQDWQKDFSQVVNKNKQDVLSIKYTETIPVLLKAIQEQQDMIQELKKEIEILKSK